ncbi:MAG: 16S rRNA (cytosine(967)-C(5))-methyltransferase RsmB [Desulfuromonadaceae bacterium]|nr:16S rRNA (cytosine(967)-C(5))-methyltransferase RsmB [Desulfuromonas sp.]MDY0185514.1 16S rRNA (cytosine(967)-C(5))-methyltransferase RsmB [Desulfuromonadaceae bacterium]
MKKKWIIPTGSDARAVACAVLLQVEQGGYSDILLDKALRNTEISTAERNLATQLVYGVLRRCGSLDYALSGLCSQPFNAVEMPVRWLMRLGAYQILYLDRVPAHAAVHTCVELARSMKLERATGFLNGVLRNLIRRADAIVWPARETDPQGCIAHTMSTPAWLAQRWIVAYGTDKAMQLAEINTTPAPNTARVNTLKVTREELLQTLAQEGVEATPTTFAPDGIIIAGSFTPQMKWLHEGLLQPQDEASILVGHLLQVQPGQRLLDVCAAPGGKTCHMAALGENQVDIVALDLHKHRLNQLEDGARRLGCHNITSYVHDMTGSACQHIAGEVFDTVLVDAPCSGLGVLRRNPELRWRREQKDIVRLATIQRNIIQNAAAHVAPGGRLVYALCTTTCEESVAVIEKFLWQNSDFIQEDLHAQVPASWGKLITPAGHFTSLSCSHAHMDCFFAAVLRRRG